MAKIREAFVYDLLQQVDKGQISFSRMVELINEKKNKPEKDDIEGEITEKETHGHKCIKCNKIFRNDIVFYNHKNIVCPDCQQNTGDLIQYVTNLLYFVHNEGRNMNDKFFDKWVEESTNDLSAYFAQSHQVEMPSDELKKIIKVLTNLIPVAEDAIKNPFASSHQEFIKEDKDNIKEAILLLSELRNKTK